uniref:Uncharacterized protein n=1 Tax=Oryza glaberrima TaxID=4538 RepID=I1QH57_ORYGL
MGPTSILSPSRSFSPPKSNAARSILSASATPPLAKRAPSLPAAPSAQCRRRRPPGSAVIIVVLTALPSSSSQHHRHCTASVGRPSAPSWPSLNVASSPPYVRTDLPRAAPAGGARAVAAAVDGDAARATVAAGGWGWGGAGGWDREGGFGKKGRKMREKKEV